MKSFKYNIPDVFLVIFFLLDVFVATISNYTGSRFLLKVGSSLVLMLVVWYHYTGLRNRHPERSTNLFANTKKLSFVVAAMTGLFALSLLWSMNPEYGALKLLNFVLSTVPAVYVFHYLLTFILKEKHSSLVSLFIWISIISAFLSIPLIIYIKPFDYLGSFNISLSSWSHVIYGRFISSVFVVLVLLLLTSEDRKRIVLLSIGILLSSVGVLISGFRGGLIGSTGLMGLFILFLLIRKQLRITNFLYLSSACILGLLIAYILVSSNVTLISRYTALENYQEMDFEGDSSIHTHLEAYNVAVDMFKDSPIIGEGFGSFKNYKGNSLTDFASYPHNIFLEFAAELGLAGIILLIVLLVLIFYYAWKLGPPVMFFFLFALFLAQFSKDVSSNTLLWLGVGTLGGGLRSRINSGSQ